MAAADNHDMQTFQARQSYDYRIREAICETGDRDLFPELNIPRSTIRSWARRGVPDVVTCDLAPGDRSDLVVKIRELRHRTALLGAVWRMCCGGRFKGVATATPKLPNVLRRSWAHLRGCG